MKHADNMSKHKISHVFKKLARVEYLLWSYLPWLLKRPYLTFWACWTGEWSLSFGQLVLFVQEIQPHSSLRTICLSTIRLKMSTLAHLSRKLTRWADSIAKHRCPSVCPHFRTRISLRPVSLTKFHVYHLWRGNNNIRFWDRSNQICGYHGNRKLPLTYNGENDVSTLAPSLLIRSDRRQIWR